MWKPFSLPAHDSFIYLSICPSIYLFIPPLPLPRHHTNILELEIFGGACKVWVQVGLSQEPRLPRHQPHLGYVVNILIWANIYLALIMSQPLSKYFRYVNLLNLHNNSISQIITSFLLQMEKLRHREVKCLLQVTDRVRQSKNSNLTCFGDHAIYHYVVLPWFLKSYYCCITFVFSLSQKHNPRHLLAWLLRLDSLRTAHSPSKICAPHSTFLPWDSARLDTFDFTRDWNLT